MHSEAHSGTQRGLDFANIWMNTLGCYHTQSKVEVDAKTSKAPDVLNIDVHDHATAYENLKHYEPV